MSLVPKAIHTGVMVMVQIIMVSITRVMATVMKAVKTTVVVTDGRGSENNE